MKTSKLLQDDAAGGSDARKLLLQDGSVVVVSISVRSYLSVKKSYQLYGYMQFKHARKTTTRYVGKVTADTFADSLAIGWRLLRQKGIIESNGWTWVKRPKGLRSRA